jgi:uncharacterized membrane protein
VRIVLYAAVALYASGAAIMVGGLAVELVDPAARTLPQWAWALVAGVAVGASMAGLYAVRWIREQQR